MRNIGFLRPIALSALATLLLSLPQTALGQATANPPATANAPAVLTPSTKTVIHTDPSQYTPVSINHLYWHFLAYVDRADTMAADTKRKVGPRPETLRNQMRDAIGFKEQDFSKIRESAAFLMKHLKIIDAQRVSVITADRQARKAAGIANDTDTTGSVQERVLEDERELLIAEEIDRLNESLGPARSAQLQKYLMEKTSGVPFTDTKAVPGTAALHRRSGELQPRSPERGKQ